jgi:ABC-type glycerol-3-phosphate transport system substrate-binding protein
MARRIILCTLIVLIAGSVSVFAQATPKTQGEAKYVPASKVTLNFWHSYTGSRAKLFERLVKEFMQENPKIEIKLSYGGDLRIMRDKLMTAIGGGSGPDIAEIDAYWTPIFAETSALLDLAPYMATTNYDLTDLMEATLQSTQYKGKTWSIPFNLSNIVLYYNKKMFKDAGLDPEVPPATWNQVIEYGKKLTKDRNNDGTVDQWGITFPLKANFGAVWYWLAFFFQQGGELFNAQQNAAAFNSPAGVAATEQWRDMVWKHKIISLSSGFNDFKVGNAAMELSSTSVLGGYRDEMGNANIGIAPLPPGKVPATVSGGGNLAIIKGCKDPQAAWVFLNWFGSTEVNRRWCLATGALPTRKSVLNSKEYQDYLVSDPKGEVMIQGLEFTRIRPNIPQYGDASLYIARAVEESVFDNKDPLPLLDRAKKETDLLFK